MPWFGVSLDDGLKHRRGWFQAVVVIARRAGTGGRCCPCARDLLSAGAVSFGREPSAVSRAVGGLAVVGRVHDLARVFDVAEAEDVS